jgi:flagellar FliJ protein
MAKKFKFRLEKVLQYRETIKADKKKDLMIANNKLYEEEAKLEQLETALLENEMRSQQPMSVGEVSLYSQYSARLRKEIEHQKIYVQQAEQAVEEAREKYIEAAKDAESLEKLKEKKRDQYREYLEKEHEKFLDELTIQRSGLKRAAKE